MKQRKKQPQARREAAPQSPKAVIVSAAAGPETRRLARLFVDLVVQESWDSARSALSVLRDNLRSPRQILAVLIEEHGARVLDLLRAESSEPEIRALLELPELRSSGRPTGRTSRDPLSYALATVIDELHIPPAKLLRALGRDASSGSSDYGWLKSRLARGRALREGETSTDPEVAVLIFIRIHHKDDPLALALKLAPYLVQGARSGVDEEQLRASLEILISSPGTA